jgi:hypothetical protein
MTIGSEERRDTVDSLLCFPCKREDREHLYNHKKYYLVQCPLMLSITFLVAGIVFIPIGKIARPCQPPPDTQWPELLISHDTTHWFNMEYVADYPYKMIDINNNTNNIVTDRRIKEGDDILIRFNDFYNVDIGIFMRDFVSSCSINEPECYYLRFTDLVPNNEYTIRLYVRYTLPETTYKYTTSIISRIEHSISLTSSVRVVIQEFGDVVTTPICNTGRFAILIISIIASLIAYILIILFIMALVHKYYFGIGRSSQ